MLPDLSLAGFKHSVASIERMSMAKLGRPRDEATKQSYRLIHRRTL
jgi:hypothetical protein